MFSPDDKLIVTGVSLDRGETEGKLVFLERESLKTVYEIVASDSVRIFLIFKIEKFNNLI